MRRNLKACLGLGILGTLLAATPAFAQQAGNTSLPPGVPAPPAPGPGFDVPPGAVAVPPPAGVGQPALAAPTTAAASAPSVVALADQLSGQAAAFVQVFSRTARVTPGGGAFLAEARVIRTASIGLSRAAAAGDGQAMALAYQDLSTSWNRMANRVNLIAPGRTGPNINQIWLMGQTIQQIAQAMP